MRVPNDAAMAPASPIRRYQLLVLGAIVAIIVLLIILQETADLFTNYLWFHSVDFSHLWRSMTLTRLELAAFFTVLFFVACWVSLLVVDKVAPKALFMAPEQELVRRYQLLVGRHRFAVRTVLSAFIAFLMGNGTADQWQNWLLFLHGDSSSFKTNGVTTTDPLFHKAIGYFVFKLPFLSFLISWLQVALIVLAIVLVIAYYLNGGLRFSGPTPRVDPRATAHFSLIFAALALVRAAGYFYVDRYTLDTSSNGLFQGAGFTAVHVRLPALNLLTIVALAAFALFVYNIYARTWVLPVVAGGLWLFLAIVIGVIFPWAVQLLQVNPAQGTLELPYLVRNIGATQQAYSLNGASQLPYQADNAATTGVINGDATSIEDSDLWDPSVAAQTFEIQQHLRGFYQVKGVAADRYVLDTGPNHTPQLTPVVVGVREIAGLSSPTWVNTHLIYTHGYGVVMAPANTTSDTPDFVLSNVPTQASSGAPTLKYPEVYYGIGESGYVVVDSKTQEFNYQPASGPASYSTYTGGGGIRVGSIWQKAAFALRFHDFNLLVSSQVTANSRIMFNQDVRTLVSKVAPFLQVDSNPYPVIDNGQIDWVVNAYTTTSFYPYAQSANTAAVTSGGFSNGFNYIRNSVVAVVNAYTGKVTLYDADPSDPILSAWRTIYPNMFQPMSAMDSTLLAHLRYPQNLLSVEATMFGRYHLADNSTGASTFYSNSATWQVSLTAENTSSYASPLYQLVELPGEASPTFDALLPMSARGSPNLAALAVASCSAADYGKLTFYEVPAGSGSAIPGPALVNATIDANSQVSSDETLLGQHGGGSSIIFGPTLLIPIEDSLLYVRPLFVASAQTSIPELQYVVAVWGGNVAIRKTLLGTDGALAAVVGTGVAHLGLPPTTNLPANIASEVRQAAALQAGALKALKTGQFEVFGRDLASVESILNHVKAQLAQLAKKKSTSTSTTTTTTSSTTTTTVPSTKSTGSTSSASGEERETDSGLGGT